MCLMLYVGTQTEEPIARTPDLGIEAVEERRAEVRQWFTLPAVRLVLAHGTCSCGFPHLLADERIEYEDWLAPVLAQSDDRDADLRSVRALIRLLDRHLAEAEIVELYPVADGSEGLSPKGTIELSLAALDAETFFFTEQFFYRVTD
jgi:hypothetical protein